LKTELLISPWWFGMHVFKVGQTRLKIGHTPQKVSKGILGNCVHVYV